MGMALEREDLDFFGLFCLLVFNVGILESTVLVASSGSFSIMLVYC